MEPLVSVIMPAYNAEKYIAEAIQSVLNQTYKQLELVIVEDCSQDSTLKVIQSYHDTRIVLLRNEVNKGISFSTNRGLDAARGKYIALLDDDDVAMPERLQLQVDYMEQHTEIDILGGKSIDVDETGNVIHMGDTTRYNPKYIKAMLLLGNKDFYNGTAMIRKDFIEKNKLRYQEDCYGMQDYKFYIDSSKVGNLSSIDEYLLVCRNHTGNESFRRRTLFARERAETYARFQDESLAASGFSLDEEDLKLIHKVLAELSGGCDSNEELAQLYGIFRKLAHQGRIMQINYQKELESLLKNLLCRFIKQLDIFDD